MKQPPLPIAVRAHLVPPAKKRWTPPATVEPPPKWGSAALIFDTETTTDPSQRLTFGSYRQAEWTPDGSLQTAEEGLFYSDDLPTRDPAGFAALKAHVHQHRADVTAQGASRRLQLISRTQFVTDLLWPAAQGESLIVGFNLPFDLSRLAVHWGVARRANGKYADRYQGGFTLGLWPDEYRPRLCIRHISSALAMLGFRRDREQGANSPGLFLDLAVLARALTDQAHSLASACTAFEVEHGKLDAAEHGHITSDYITYNRRDTEATLQLLEKLRIEYDRHPIALPPTRAFSAATIAKAYLREAGITPMQTRTPVVPPELLGQAMTAYFGGRAECHIRRTALPVITCDVLSMYPTVQALLGLRDWLAADALMVEDYTEEAQSLLQGCTPDQVLDRAYWRRLGFLAELEPDGEVLPVRARYRLGSDSFNIGVNPLTTKLPLCYAGPDLVAAVLLGGKTPKVRRAWRLVPRGQLADLKPVRLRGQLEVDPRTEDLFRSAIELRKSPASRADPWLGRFLKILANSGAYGINVQVDVVDTPDGEPRPVEVYGLGAPFTQPCTALEQPGEYYFPPVAALITASARLILALLETEVRLRGGSWVMCDTDSIAIVATPTGGVVPCPGGPERLPDGREAVLALSFADVEGIQQLLEGLKPYDPTAVPESLLKFEKENYDGGQLVGVGCFALAAKRYVLFRRDGHRRPVIVKASEHGLGHLLDPRDAAEKPRDGSPQESWIDVFWRLLLDRQLGRRHTEPAWLDRPAVTRFAVTSPHYLDPLKHQMEGLWPFNFMLAGHVAPFGHPAGTDPARFQLVRAFTKNPAAWLEGPWIDRYSGKAYAVTTDPGDDRADVVRLKTYRDVLEAFERHPEAKSLGPHGEPCGPITAGVLGRRPVDGQPVLLIGKETHRLEEVHKGLVHDWAAVQPFYADPARDPWQTVVLPLLRQLPKGPLARAVGVSARAIQAIRNGQNHPAPETLAALVKHLTRAARRMCRLKRTSAEQRQLATAFLELYGRDGT